MPIQELVDFFNDQFHEMPVRYIPDEPLYLRGKQVIGRFYGYRIHSQFRRLVNASTGYTACHDACTHVTDAFGHVLSAVDLFAAADEASAVIYIDRLCRMVHMLNYLVHSERYASLFFYVDPRHIVSVRDNHGRYFDDVLQRCGLAPSQVVITLNGRIRGSESEALTRGLENYRRNGYRIATLVNRTELALDGIGVLTKLAPDFARLEGAYLHAALAKRTVANDYRDIINHFRGIGITAIQDEVNSDTQARFATAAGVALLSGQIAGHLTARVDWDRTAATHVRENPSRPTQIRFPN